MYVFYCLPIYDIKFKIKHDEPHELDGNAFSIYIDDKYSRLESLRYGYSDPC
jgi:hypothetical protein